MRGRDIIMDLYYGDIRPSERDFCASGGCKKEARVFAEQAEWFERRMTGEAKRRLHKLLDSETTLLGSAQYENFRVGFQLGVALMMEACETPDGLFLEPY